MASFELSSSDNVPSRTPGDVSAAIHALLDLVERPVGARRGYVLKTSPESDRAIVALFDAVGRNP